MEKERIGYIDAMRGLTMILVVYSHVCNYCLGDRWMGLNDVMFLFRLPCFFFISGWLFAGSSAVSSLFTPSAGTPIMPTVRKVLRHKFRVQIIPTFIFLFLLAGPTLFLSRLGATKGGYWFTFALFEFFCLYLFSLLLFRKIRPNRMEWGMGITAVTISVAAFSYDIYYHRIVESGVFSSLLTDVLGFLSFTTWRYYLFFYIGALVRRNFALFVRLTDKKPLFWLFVAGFLLIVMLPHSNNILLEYTIFAIGGIFGLTIVFTFFRKFQRWFSNDRWLGRSFIYIGTRTLNIYLLHYFFLPRFLAYSVGVWLMEQSCLPLEMVVALSIALAVVALCLLASRLICLSPFLGYWLFGKKDFK